jgi:hypothetical protein
VRTDQTGQDVTVPWELHKCSDTLKLTIINGHPNDDVPASTLASVLKQAGMNRGEL